MKLRRSNTKKTMNLSYTSPSAEMGIYKTYRMTIHYTAKITPVYMEAYQNNINTPVFLFPDHLIRSYQRNTIAANN